jgi:glycosyltransferase involved in cell wall biosynthesis
MNVLHVSMAYPPATAWSGPIPQLHALVRASRELGVDARVITTDASGHGRLDVPVGRWTHFEGVPVFYARCWNTRYFLAPSAWAALRRAAADADLIHVTQVWSWLTPVAAWIARELGKPIVFAPCGGFDPEARAFRSGKKAMFNVMGGRWAVGTASGMRATSDRERDAIVSYLPGMPVVVIPNSLILPAADPSIDLPRPDARRKAVVFLGRLHPIKNLPLLLRSWASIPLRPDGAHLAFVGPDENGHRAELEALAGELGIAKEVRISGNIPSSEITGLLASAWCLVLPSKTENFGNVVTEALACGTPVIASTGTPWRVLLDGGCGWWVPPTTDALAGAIGTALGLSVVEREAMGAKGRSLVHEMFDVGAVARKVRAWHETIAAQGRPRRTQIRSGR